MPTPAMTLREHLVRAWYAPGATPLTVVLLPLAMLFRGIAALRRACYGSGACSRHRLPVPVIIVGNITVGGTGKTPLVIALCEALAARGFTPGVVSRGAGRRDPARVAVVAGDASAAMVGDEPLLIARRGVPVAVGADRAAAGRALLAAHPQCDVIVADDGLQHYALERDIEVAVLDGARGIGNGWLLPAGPLRESVARLDRVDEIVVNGAWRAPRSLPRPASATMQLVARRFVNVTDPSRTCSASDLKGARLQAVAGLGHPERFFAMLRALGLEATTRAFPDHHEYAPGELAFPGADAILMTEKDAVKCGRFADARCWYLRVDAAIDGALIERIVARLRTLHANARPTRAGDTH